MKAVEPQVGQRHEDVRRKQEYYYHIIIFPEGGLGGLGVTCSLRDPMFAGSNATEVDGFLSLKNPERKSSVRDFKLGVPSLRFQAR